MRAVRSGEREVLMGASALQLVFGDMVAPGWLDRKLAEDAVPAQKSETPEPGGRPDNLDAPVTLEEADPVAASGRFGAQAKAEGASLGGALSAAAVLALVAGLAFLTAGAR